MNSSLRYMIVDDNELDQLAVASQAARYPHLQLTGIYNNALEALEAFESLKPELVFLDVEMPGWTGLQLLKSIREHVPLAVFITSHAEFALEGYELEAFDYILKPLTEKRFDQTIARINEYRLMKKNAQAYTIHQEQETISIKEGHSQVKIPLAEIVYLEAMDSYTKVVLRDKKYLTLSSLTHMLEQLPPEKFGRIHRSYAVAISKIEELRSGELVCGGHELPVGKTYKALISKWKI